MSRVNFKGTLIESRWRVMAEKLNDRLLQSDKHVLKNSSMVKRKQYAATKFFLKNSRTTTPSSIVDLQRVCGTRSKNDTAFQFRSECNRRDCRYRSLRFANLLVDLVTAHDCAVVSSRIGYTWPIIYRVAIGGKTVRPISESRN